MLALLPLLTWRQLLLPLLTWRQLLLPLMTWPGVRGGRPGLRKQ